VSAAASEPGPAADGHDWQVLARVGAGDTEAFGQLVERHQLRLLRLCERLLADQEEARDAVQEVFVRLFRKAASYRPHGQLFTLLYRIAVNLCLNRLRRRRLLRFVGFGGDGEHDETALPEPAADGPDAAATVAARERWTATRRALDRLPANQRAVVVLAKLEGLPYKEIAATLGITEGAVESRLVRAMRTLTAADLGHGRSGEMATAAGSARGGRRGGDGVRAQDHRGKRVPEEGGSWNRDA
jgi:RNA polymerase sigma-70 factor (ECF subfamily)